MAQIAICDNDLEDLETVSRGVKSWIQKKARDSQFEMFSSANQLQKKIEDGAHFDVYVLDIVMPRIDGIELGREIRERTSEAAIIYTTSEKEYALSAFGIHALRYIMKPVQEEELFSALDMAQALIQTRPRHILQLADENEIRKVNLDEVMYIENNVRTLLCTMSDGQVIRGNHYDRNFEQAVGAVNELDNFVRVHKSFYINMKYVSSLQPDSFLMDDGTEIYIASRRISQARASYMNFVSGNGGSQ